MAHWMAQMGDWIAGNWIEITGAVLSLIYLFLSIRQHILLWPVGLLSALLYIVVFYQSKFYADMGLNGYYLMISIYGWITWSNAKKKESKEFAVSRVGTRRGMLLIGLMVVLFLLLGYFLDKKTDSPVPYWDAFTTSGSIIATWMLARKILEHWILWIIVDVISLGLYIWKGLLPTAMLFTVYTAMAVIGYFQWKKSIND